MRVKPVAQGICPPKTILKYEGHVRDNRERKLASSNLLESFSNVMNDYIFEIGHP